MYNNSGPTAGIYNSTQYWGRPHWIKQGTEAYKILNTFQISLYKCRKLEISKHIQNTFEKISWKLI